MGQMRGPASSLGLAGKFAWVQIETLIETRSDEGWL